MHNDLELFNGIFNSVKSKGTFIHSAKNPFNYDEWKFNEIIIKSKDVDNFKKIVTKELDCYLINNQVTFNYGDYAILSKLSTKVK